VKIPDATQIRAWDEYTISHEHIPSVSLMERAAAQSVQWIEENNMLSYPFIIFCGKGNNGGDGLAIARMLLEKQCSVTVYILEFGHKGTLDFQANLERLHTITKEIKFIQTEEHFDQFLGDEIIIDALLGTGLNRPLDGLTAKLVTHINRSGCRIIAIDIPSGLFTDHSSKGNAAIQASYTLSFQCYKLAFLLAENAAFTGEVHLLDIGLNQEYYQSLITKYEIIDRNIIRNLYTPRNKFAHKGIFGHALLVAGSYGKMGAAALTAKACLRSGAGLVTCHIPRCGYEILQTNLPEAMVSTDFNSSFVTKIELDINHFDAIGTGPGIGTASETKDLLWEIFKTYRKPIVIDADALNCLASRKEMMASIPAGSILTPHPKEFERLFGETKNEEERIALAQQKARELQAVIIVKGHHSFIALPDGRGYFNSTGNAGMATGGSGDVLTGILSGLLAQHYNPAGAAILGVYLHGSAGDFAAENFSQEAMTAGDITDQLGNAFKNLSS
jgi:NAD(P)H-hydrate epimerase